MTPEQQQALQYLASLPLQAVLMVIVVKLWNAYQAEHTARIDDLKTVISNLNSRMLMVEDKLDIKPPLTNATFDVPDKP